jgi:hypothetical protein
VNEMNSIAIIAVSPGRSIRLGKFALPEWSYIKQIVIFQKSCLTQCTLYHKVLHTQEKA